MASTKPVIAVRVTPELKRLLRAKVDQMRAEGRISSEAELGASALADYIYSLPILGVISAGTGMDVSPMEHNYYRGPGIESLPSDAYGLIVAGNSMDGGAMPIRNGETLVFVPCAAPDNGRVVHAEWRDGLREICTVKKYTRDLDGTVTLTPANEDGYEPLVFNPEQARAVDLEIRGVFKEVLR